MRYGKLLIGLTLLATAWALAFWMDNRPNEKPDAVGMLIFIHITACLLAGVGITVVGAMEAHEWKDANKNG